MSELIQINALSKVYDQGLVMGVHDISLTLEKGKIYALKGASGCGKSTLLNLIGTLDEPDSGEIRYEGALLSELQDVAKFRREFIGFIFQFHHLIPALSLLENVESPLLPDKKVTSKERYNRAMMLLEQMGIRHRADAFSNKISGGERQRGAIARALINNPKLLLADEPTGNVDSKTVKVILRKLIDHIEGSSGTLLIATHDQTVADIADVLISMDDGAITSITENTFSKQARESL